MYRIPPRTILFQQEHSLRVFVPLMDIVSTPGLSAPGALAHWRTGALSQCGAGADDEKIRFRLISAYLSEAAASIRAATGFNYEEPEHLPAAPDPTDEVLALLRGPVCDEMQETYPEFCRRVWQRNLQEQIA